MSELNEFEQLLGLEMGQGIALLEIVLIALDNESGSLRAELDGMDLSDDALGKIHNAVQKFMNKPDLRPVRPSWEARPLYELTLKIYTFMNPEENTFADIINDWGNDGESICHHAASRKVEDWREFENNTGLVLNMVWADDTEDDHE